MGKSIGKRFRLIFRDKFKILGCGGKRVMKIFRILNKNSKKLNWSKFNQKYENSIFRKKLFKNNKNCLFLKLRVKKRKEFENQKFNKIKKNSKK